VTSSGRRPYRAPRRDAIRNQTRERIRSAARELFLLHGYAATTLAQVGERAGVSRRYVQMAFGSKAELLSEVIRVAVAGDDAPLPLARRERWTAMLGAGGQGTLTAYAALSTEICERTAGLLAVATTAAESDDKLAEMRASALHRRHQDCATVIGALSADGSLTSGYTLAEAADIFYALTSPETFLVLTRERGWPRARYEKWLARILTASLLDNGRAHGMAQGKQTD
jgi:AcrR family transcriptional regulator